MEVKTIRDVDEETWNEFKALAVKSNLKMSLLLKLMVRELEKKSEDLWNKILNKERNLSEDEARSMLKTLEKARKERGFRE